LEVAETLGVAESLGAVGSLEVVESLRVAVNSEVEKKVGVEETEENPGVLMAKAFRAQVKLVQGEQAFALQLSEKGQEQNEVD
jgi:hypothetical protein